MDLCWQKSIQSQAKRYPVRYKTIPFSLNDFCAHFCATQPRVRVSTEVHFRGRRWFSEGNVPDRGSNPRGDATNQPPSGGFFCVPTGMRIAALGGDRGNAAAPGFDDRSEAQGEGATRSVECAAPRAVGPSQSPWGRQPSPSLRLAGRVTGSTDPHQSLGSAVSFRRTAPIPTRPVRSRG